MIRILVADDEPIERMVVLKKIKKYYGTDVELVEAENGREVVEKFQREPFQIAVLDIEMPGKNGLEAAAAIRDMHGICEMIFLTAFDEFQYAKKAITVRAVDYLLKPVSEEELIGCLEEAMQRVKDSLKRQESISGGNGTQAAVPKEGLPGDKSLIAEKGEPAAERPEDIKSRTISRIILQYIEEHHQEDISLQDVAGNLNYSEAYFCKIFKQCFEQNFIEFLSKFRVEKAKKLLENISINVKDISVQVGYHDSNYFAKVFKRFTGVTPSEYRMNILKESSEV